MENIKNIENIENIKGLHFVQTFINRDISTIQTVSYTGIYQFLEKETENILTEKPYEIIHTFFVLNSMITKNISYHFIETGLTEKEKKFLIKELELE